MRQDSFDPVPVPPPWQVSLSDRVQNVSTSFLILAGAVVLALVYWSLLRAPSLLARKDNPRLVAAELRVQRGRILDRNGAVLAETVGEPGALERRYRLPAAPAVGYYSLRYGVAGVEAAYDDVLRGRPDGGWTEWWNGMLHRYPVGRDVQLTLDAGLQAAADSALGDRHGAAVLLEARSGDVLALVSHPSYDPNLLAEQFATLSADDNAPLLDRATQALYQPGTALQPLLLAAGLEQGLVKLDAVISNPAVPVQAGGVSASCVTSPTQDETTITATLSHACPAFFVHLAVSLGPAGLVDGLADFGLFEPPGLPIAVAVGSRPAPSYGEELTAEAVGQGVLTLSPLQMARALATIANEGDIPLLRLVRRVGGGAGPWEVVVPSSAPSGGGISFQTAAAVAQLMAASGEDGEPGGHDVASHAGVAVAGPGDALNTWFLGFAPASAPRPFARYVVVVLLEGSANVGAASRIGREILAAAIP